MASGYLNRISAASPLPLPCPHCRGFSPLRAAPPVPRTCNAFCCVEDVPPFAAAPSTGSLPSTSVQATCPWAGTAPSDVCLPPGYADRLLLTQFRRRFQVLAPDVMKKYTSAYEVPDESKVSAGLAWGAQAESPTWGCAGAGAPPALSNTVRAFFATRSNSWSSLQAAPALALPVPCVSLAALSPNELGHTSISLPWTGATSQSLPPSGIWCC